MSYRRGCPQCNGRVEWWASAGAWICVVARCPWGEQGEWWLGDTLWHAPGWGDEPDAREIVEAPPHG